MNDHTVKAFDADIVQLRGLIAQMGGLAEHAIAAAMEALRRRDLDGASAIVAGDKRIDALEMDVTYMVDNPKTISQVAHLLFVAKNLERVGDHATNIAEMVYFAATGLHMAERDRGGIPPN